MQSVEADLIQGLSRAREQIRADHFAGQSGLETARRLSGSLDDTVKALWKSSQGTSLVAIGEYGRGELGPGSEIDLLVLGPEIGAEEAVRALCDQLYRGGVEAGFALQTPGEALAAADENIRSEVACLDARYIAGDSVVFDQWKHELLTQSRRNKDRFIERLRKAPETRHLTTDDATAGLEPDLVEGRGALGDVAALRWIQQVFGPDRHLKVPEDISETANLLHRTRAALHYFTGRNTDVLQMHYQEPVAEVVVGEKAFPSPEIALMRSIYAHCRAVAFLIDSVLVPDFASRSEPAARFSENLTGAGPWPTGALETFLEILSSGAGGRIALNALDLNGELVRAIPEWAGIRCLPQRNVYHRFAVDVHSFETAKTVTELAGGPHDLTRRIAAQTPASDQPTLLIAALLHDIGKGSDKDHCLEGERLAAAAARRMGLDQKSSDDVAWLVRNHLILTETATKRDIGDEALVRDLANQIGTEGRLRMLFLLSVADAKATGPDAWSTWKATLVSRLFERVANAMRGVEGAGGDSTRHARMRAEEISAALPGYKDLERHLVSMPQAWLFSQPLSDLVEQSRLMLEFDPLTELKLVSKPDREAGVWELTIVARDRPGLFNKISGVLALHDLNALGAQAYTREDGLALEVFRLHAFGEEEQRFEHVAEDSIKALHGRIALDMRLAEKRLGQADRQPRGKQEAPRVVIDNNASELFTVIEVHATDRIGRLHDITKAMAELELDIHLAKVSTYSEDIIDSFYVSDLDHSKITDPDYLTEIEKAILHRLG